jgi:hypothetical protein
MILYVITKQSGSWPNGSSEYVARRVCGLIGMEDHFRYVDGRPILIDSPYHLSVSHSGATMVVAIANQPLGIDVELHRTIEPGVIERLKLNPDNPLLDWCSREAAIKLHQDPNRLLSAEHPDTVLTEVDLSDKSTCVVATHDPIEKPTVYYLHENHIKSTD